MEGKLGKGVERGPGFTLPLKPETFAQFLKRGAVEFARDNIRMARRDTPIQLTELTAALVTGIATGVITGLVGLPENYALILITAVAAGTSIGVDRHLRKRLSR